MPCVPCGIGVNQLGFFLQMCGNYIFGGPDIPTTSTQPPLLIVRQPSANLAHPLLREDSSVNLSLLRQRRISSVLPVTKDTGVQTSAPSSPLLPKVSLEWDYMSEQGQPFNSSSPTSPFPPFPVEALAALAELRASSPSNIEGNRSHSASPVPSTHLSSKAQHLFDCIGETLSSIDALMMMDHDEIDLQWEHMTLCLDCTVKALKAYYGHEQYALALTYAMDLEMMIKEPLSNPEAQRQVEEGNTTSIHQLLNKLKEWCLQVKNAAFS